MNLKLVRRRTVFEGRVFDIIVDDVEYPSGNPGVREVARHSGGAVVVPLFDDGRIALIRQHRYPLDEFIPELPAGKLYRGEDPLDCARRELEEETGYHAREWTLLTPIFTTPGFCDEVLHIFLARGLSEAPGGRKPEEGEESMTVETTTLGEAVAMVERREIRDGKSICGILLAARLVAGGMDPKGGGSASRDDAPGGGPGGGPAGTLRLGIDRCVRTGCPGVPITLSRHERNNWITAELRCTTCGTRFTVKAES